MIELRSNWARVGGVAVHESDGRLRSIAPTSAPFGKNFIDHLLRVATTQHRIVLIIFSPVENVAVISLRRLYVVTDFPNAIFAQLQNVPSHAIALGSGVAFK